MEGDLFCSIGHCSDNKEDQDYDVVDLVTKTSSVTLRRMPWCGGDKLH